MIWISAKWKRKKEKITPKQQQLNWYSPAVFISMKSLILVSCPVINQNKRKTNKNSVQLFHTDSPDLPSWGFFVMRNCFLATRPRSCQTANTESMTSRKKARRRRVGWGLPSIWALSWGSNTMLEWEEISRDWSPFLLWTNAKSACLGSALSPPPALAITSRCEKES